MAIAQHPDPPSAPSPDETAGLFGPDSMVWRIDRESALLLGAGRALLLQLAHPWVAQAIADHSAVLDDPIGRYHRTFGTVYAMVFGSTDQALERARRVHAVHARIGGTLSGPVGRFAAGSPYAATDRAAALWVHATLAHTALQAYELVLPRLDDADRDRYCRESTRFAALFGLDAEEVPARWSDLDDYVSAMLAGSTLEVGAVARSLTDPLLGLQPGSIGRWTPSWYRELTARLLPAELARSYGLSRTVHTEDRALRRLRRLYPHLPARLRYVGPYFEALERLSGRSPSARTRLSNRLWTGAPTLSGAAAAGAAGARAGR